MRWFRFAALIIIAMLLQASLVDVIAVANVKPDFLLIELVFFAVYCSPSEAIATSFLTGFAADVIGSVIGPQTISFGLLGSLLAYLNSVIAIRRIPYQSFVIAVVGFLAGEMGVFFSFMKGQPSPAGAFAVLVGTPLYSAVVGPYLFLLLAWWLDIKTHRSARR